MQKFFTDTIENSFIKELVYSANIPSYDSISDGDFAFKDVVYIYRNKIIRITHGGYIGKDSNVKYVEVRPYHLNEKIEKITENYISKYNYYDSDTHYQLGRFLRLYRDITGVDMMPFYNCYSGKVVSDVYLGNTDDVRYVGDDKFTTNTSQYKISLVPIRFNKKYTICIDSYSGVRMKPIFYGNFGLVVNNPFPLISKNYLGKTEIRKSATSFKSPFLYEFDMNSVDVDSEEKIISKETSESGKSYIKLSHDVKREHNQYLVNKISYILNDQEIEINNYSVDGNEVTLVGVSAGNEITISYISQLNYEEKAKMMNYEKYLYLLIQLPISNNSSILVQEGDFVNLTNSVYDKRTVNSGDLVRVGEQCKYGGKDIQVVFDGNFSNDFIDVEVEKTVALDDENNKYISIYGVDINNVSLKKEGSTLDSDGYIVVSEYNSAKIIIISEDISVEDVITCSYKSKMFFYNGSEVDISRVYSEDGIDKLTSNELNNILLSDLQLQRLNTHESYPYSTRLIEYLLKNVITSEEEFGDNIARVQDVLGRIDMRVSTGMSGVWNNEIRSALFRKYISANKSNGRNRSVNDINGFVDKDIENYLSIADNK